MQKSRINIIFLFLLGLLASCEKPPIEVEDKPDLKPANGYLYVLNEGNFQSGNATIDYLSFADNSVNTNAFENKNGRPLGDVLQSMNRLGDKGYLVVNNSAKIEVVNLPDLSSIATITGFKSPRYICFKDADKAYVSEYYNGGIKVVNIQANAIQSTIPITGNCEEMVLLDDKLYVTVTNKDLLYVINTTTDELIDSVKLAYFPNSIQVDKDKTIWVLSAGNNSTTNYKNGALQQIQPTDNSIMQSYPIQPRSEHGAIKLRINNSGTRLFWINKEIYSYTISSTPPSETPFISIPNGALWALNYDSLNNEIYVGNALDYNQRSVISHYDMDGISKGEFKGGVISTSFYFWYK